MVKKGIKNTFDWKQSHGWTAYPAANVEQNAGILSEKVNVCHKNRAGSSRQTGKWKQFVDTVTRARQYPPLLISAAQTESRPAAQIDLIHALS